MTAELPGRMLTLPYAGHRWLGPARLRGASGHSTRHPAHRAPARHMDEGTVNGTIAPLFAAQGLDPLVKQVRELVTPGRFEHIERVAELADAIAAANGFTGAERAKLVKAALLHDAARDLGDEELMRLAPPRIELERHHPLALHGRAARALAEGWGVTDAAVLDAVEGHVFGVSPFDLIGMALYVADVSEPGRGVNADIRELAMTDLAAAYRSAVCTKVEYLRECGKEIHPSTLATYRAIVEPEHADARGVA